MQTIKNIAKKLLGSKNIVRIRNYRIKKILKKNFINDYKLYKKHSSVFTKDTYHKIESEITLRYHSIEKGFLHNPIRYRFAKKRVEELLDYLRFDEVKSHVKDVQIQSAILNLCAYYELHLNNNINISDYFNKEEYEKLTRNMTLNAEPVKHHTSSSYFKFKQTNFEQFSKSRCSVRDFTGESLSQLIVVTSDRSFFYSIGERYQLYIDGGIYLMNLLYALHYYEIAACPAHWGMPIEADIKAQKIISLNESEKIICLIAIGKPIDEFKTTLSLRRSFNENLRVIN